MKHEMKCRALIRSILRDARANESTIVLVKCEGEQLDHAQRERDIIDAVFSVDESQLVFIGDGIDEARLLSQLSDCLVWPRVNPCK